MKWVELINFILKWSIKLEAFVIWLHFNVLPCGLYFLSYFGRTDIHKLLQLRFFSLHFLLDIWLRCDSFISMHVVLFLFILWGGCDSIFQEMSLFWHILFVRVLRIECSDSATQLMFAILPNQMLHLCVIWNGFLSFQCPIEIGLAIFDYKETTFTMVTVELNGYFVNRLKCILCFLSTTMGHVLVVS